MEVVMTTGTLIRGASVFVAALAGIASVAVPALGWMVGPVALLCALVAANYVPESGHAA
jgi:hypothetical protein